MPKPNNQNKISSHPTARKPHSKLFWIMLVLALVIIGGAAAIAAVHYQNQKAIAAERARFDQTDSDLQKVAAEIIKTIPPEKHTYTRSCQYQSRDYAPRPIVCSMVFSSYYVINSFSDADDLTGKVNHILNNNNAFHSASSHADWSVPFADISTSGNGYIRKSDLYTDYYSHLECPINLDIFDSGHPSLLYGPIKEEKMVLGLTVQCYGPARTLAYPLAND